MKKKNLATVFRDHKLIMRKFNWSFFEVASIKLISYTLKALGKNEIRQFIRNGFIKIENAFPRQLANEGRDILWRDTGCDPEDPQTWTRPVIRLGDYIQRPFCEAVNTKVLHAAFNQLVGEDKWLPRTGLGTFPIRFPNPANPGDDGWHVDASFPGDDPLDFLNWRINLYSRGRALLMLFLFSDVDKNDAPTRIRVGSHLDVTKLLEPASYNGYSFMELSEKLDVTADHPTILATGAAGTVYLCHPFIVHAAQPHKGKNPRFMAQPPLHLRGDLQLQRNDGKYSPVELALKLGLAE